MDKEISIDEVIKSLQNTKRNTDENKILRDQKNGLLLTGLPDNVDVITVGQEFVVEGQKVNISYE